VIERWERTFEGYVFGWFANLLILRGEDANLDDKTTILERVIKSAKELFSSGRFLWHTNRAVAKVFSILHTTPAE
jgi:hypothetical protein